MNAVVKFERRQFFVGMTEITGNPNAEHLHELLLKTIMDITGLTRAELARKAVCIATDGAAVMSGDRKGVQKLFQQDAPWAVRVHCAAHRLNLVVQSVDGSLVFSVTVEVADQVQSHACCCS